MVIFVELLGLAALGFLFFRYLELQCSFLLHVLHIKSVGQSFSFNFIFLFFFPKLLLFDFSPLEIDFAYKINYSNIYFFLDSSTSYFFLIWL